MPLQPCLPGALATLTAVADLYSPPSHRLAHKSQNASAPRRRAIRPADNNATNPATFGERVLSMFVSRTFMSWSHPIRRIGRGS